MKVPTSILLVFIICLVNSSWVHKYSQDELNQNLQNSKNVWLVYRGKSSEERSALDEVSQIFKGIFNVAVLDQQIGKLSLVGDDKENQVSYNGDFSVDSIIAFVLQNTDQLIEARSKIAKDLKANQQFQQKEAQRAKKQWDDQLKLRQKSNTIVLDAQNWNSFTNSRDSYVINFYESNCSACIQLNNEWQQVSTELKGKVKIAKVNITQQGNHVLEEQIKLQSYPSIRFYPSGPKKVSDFNQYNGVNKRFSLLQWINMKLSQKSQSVDIPTLSKENYETLCKNTKNTCIIVFLDQQNTQVSQKVQELSLKHLKKPITFLISKKGEQQKFANQLGVQSYPDSVLVYCKQKKLWRTGQFNHQQIDQAINEISMGNRNNFQKYTFVQQLV